MKLHLGCGSKILENFVNIDIRPMDRVDRVENISTLPSCSANSSQLIYACHVLEHFNRHKINSVISRWYEILHPGGILRIAVPDFEKIVRIYKSGAGVDSLIGHLYGGQDHSHNYHHCCWDFDSLSKSLKQAGFQTVDRYDWRKTEHHKIDDYSQAYYPHMDKEHGLLMSLNVEAIK